MNHQLKSMTMLELELKRELSTLGQVINIELLDQWEVKVKEHPHDMQTEIDALNNAAPQNKEEQHEIFVLKKGILEEDSNKGGAIKLAGQIWSDEIYTSKPGFYHNLIVVVTL